MDLLKQKSTEYARAKELAIKGISISLKLLTENISWSFSICYQHCYVLSHLVLNVP